MLFFKRVAMFGPTFAKQLYPMATMAFPTFERDAKQRVIRPRSFLVFS